MSVVLCDLFFMVNQFVDGFTALVLYDVSKYKRHDAQVCFTVKAGSGLASSGFNACVCVACLNVSAQTLLDGWTDEWVKMLETYANQSPVCKDSVDE